MLYNTVTIYSVAVVLRYGPPNTTLSRLLQTCVSAGLDLYLIDRKSYSLLRCRGRGRLKRALVDWVVSLVGAL
jgi:hypothetical protein